jgi:hypothetical protein
MTSEIAERHGLDVRVIDGQELIAAEDAESFLVGCREERAIVVGLEGLRLEGDDLIPGVDAIAVFTTATDASESVQEALQFLRGLRGADYLYHFTLVSGNPAVFRAETLQGFFVGTASAKELEAEASSNRPNERGAQSWVSGYIWDRDSEELTVARPMMIALCDAFLRGDLTAGGLAEVVRMLIVSELFVWDDDLIAQMIHEWDSPEINYALTPENIEECKQRLVGEQI